MGCSATRRGLQALHAQLQRCTADGHVPHVARGDDGGDATRRSTAQTRSAFTAGLPEQEAGDSSAGIRHRRKL